MGDNKGYWPDGYYGLEYWPLGYFPAFTGELPVPVGFMVGDINFAPSVGLTTLESFPNMEATETLASSITGTIKISTGDN